MLTIGGRIGGAFRGTLNGSGCGMGVDPKRLRLLEKLARHLTSARKWLLVVDVKAELGIPNETRILPLLCEARARIRWFWFDYSQTEAVRLGGAPGSYAIKGGRTPEGEEWRRASPSCGDWGYDEDDSEEAAEERRRRREARETGKAHRGKWRDYLREWWEANPDDGEGGLFDGDETEERGAHGSGSRGVGEGSPGGEGTVSRRIGVLDLGRRVSEREERARVRDTFSEEREGKEARVLRSPARLRCNERQAALRAFRSGRTPYVRQLALCEP